MSRSRKFQVNDELQLSASRWICGQVAKVATVTFLLCGVLSLDAGVASAMQFELGDDARLDVDVSLTYGAAWRAKDQSSYLADGPPHPFQLGSGGDANFDEGDMINNRVSALIDIDLQYKDYGVFVRPRYYYDDVYDNDDLEANGMFKKFYPKTQDQHAEKAEILDAFVYGTFELGDHSTSLRVGKHVLSWGESLFILNGISSAMSPIDATAANVPGVELKDLFLPVGQVSLEFGLTDNLNLSTFYQWEWEKNRLDEAGAYFSTSGLLDDAIRDHPLYGPLRGDDIDPSDDGQWGLSLRYLAEELNGTEFGLYYINYHEKMPYVENTVPLLLSFAGLGAGDIDLLAPFGAGTYNLAYSEDVQLYGASVSGMIGDTNVAAEVSYRQDMSVQVEQADSNFAAWLPDGHPLKPTVGMVDYLINTSERNWENQDADVVQVQLSTITIMPQTSFYDNLAVTAEVGMNRVTGGLEGKQLWNDRTAWGGAVKASFDYYQILQNLDLNIPITYKFNPNGVSSVLGTFSEDADSIGVAFEFTYDAVYKLGLGYVDFLNDEVDNNKADRDFYSLNLKYTF